MTGQTSEKSLQASATDDLGEKRVRGYAARHFAVAPEAVGIEALTPDASTRKYFRVYPQGRPGESHIIALYPSPFNPHDNTYLDVTRLFERARLPVPRVIDVAGTEGITWELNYFFDHFFGSRRHEEFEAGAEQAIKNDLRAIASELASRPRVLCHRDYHAMNLMVDARGELRVIDHQDARMGPVTYDLVPLLVERRLQPADEAWVSEYQDYFLRKRVELGLPEVAAEEFRHEFNLMTVQRQLKATGTFSYQTGVCGRGEYYEKYIGPAVATVLRAMGAPGMKDYPALRAALEEP
jgi:aminoglycoside/choline kinase family phosphotransferase